MTFHHGDRVRLGWHGPTGVILRCAKRDGSGHYFKIKLDRGDWVWPDITTVVDSEGAYELRCSECEGLFRAPDLMERICPNCDRRGRQNDPADFTVRHHRAFMNARKRG